MANNKTRELQRITLNVCLIDAIGANFGRSHRQNLASVTRISEDLLIAGHRGVEADLARNGTSGTE